jgi:predicted negative regulator of RcsB-dependent stress response
MANHLDLEEQEQLDQLKHFWKQFGNLISWGLIAILSCVAIWNGYQYWQRTQAAQAAAMYDEVERVARTGDAQKLDRAFGDMKDKFASTAFAYQAALLVAKTSYEAGNLEGAKTALTWVADKSQDKGYASVARIRLAGLLMDAKSYDAALKMLDSNISDEFTALAADRRGDVYVSQGEKAKAATEYQKAYIGLDEKSEYRRLVEVKLNALGVTPKGTDSVATPNTAKPDGSK